MSRHVGGNNSAGADDRKVADFDPRQHNRSRADERTCANSHLAGKARAAAHVSPDSHNAIVFHGGIVVHDCMIPDDRINLHNCSSQHDGAPADFCC